MNNIHVIKAASLSCHYQERHLVPEQKKTPGNVYMMDTRWRCYILKLFSMYTGKPKTCPLFLPCIDFFPSTLQLHMQEFSAVNANILLKPIKPVNVFPMFYHNLIFSICIK